MREFILSVPAWEWFLIIVWELVWKAIAMWRSARRDQLIWFILLAGLNTLGILPIIYLITHRK